VPSHFPASLALPWIDILTVVTSLFAEIRNEKRRGDLHQPSTTAMSHRLRIRMTDHPQRTIFFGVELEILMSKVVEQNTLKRRGVGLRACDPERACPGFTLFAPVFEQNRTVYLIDLQGELVHTWQLPYAPGLSGYLTERGTLLYNGRTSENNFLSRFPFKGGRGPGGRLERQGAV
jgi:hypothetical protein